MEEEVDNLAKDSSVNEATDSSLEKSDPKSAAAVDGKPAPELKLDIDTDLEKAIDPEARMKAYQGHFQKYLEAIKKESNIGRKNIMGSI